MIKQLSDKISNIVLSEEHTAKVKLVCDNYGLSEDDFYQIDAILSSVLLGSVEESFLLSTILEKVEINMGMAEKLTNDLKRKIIAPFKEWLNNEMALFIKTGQSAEVVSEDTASSSAPAEHAQAIPDISISTFRQTPSSLSEIASEPQRPAPIAPAPRKEESLSKADILDQIENPPRTVIKKYVLEHEPITDPDHLIDDKIDNVPKLQDHYND